MKFYYTYSHETTIDSQKFRVGFRAVLLVKISQVVHRKVIEEWCLPLSKNAKWKKSLHWVFHS